jgi:catechol 2,3-dioxygenase-like lactoylglutathione lyase family enzyme
MFNKDTKAFSSFSTSDVEKTRVFYAETLGLEVTDMMGGLVLHFAGGNQTFIYPKPNHVPAEFTILNFMVPDIDATVDWLTGKGVAFEHYSEGQLKTDEKGIARGDGVNGPSIAWFKDPAGNFLSVIEDKK